MKILNSILVFFLAIIILAGCTTVRTIPVTAGTYEGIEVYTAKLPERKFDEITLIQVEGRAGRVFSGPKVLMDRLIQQAKNEGADGLVNVHYQMHERGSTIYGTAVKFVELVNQSN